MGPGNRVVAHRTEHQKVPVPNKDRPRNYPGFEGRVWIRFSSPQVDGEGNFRTWGSDAFRRTLSHVGTGGGGAYSGPWEKISSAYYNALEITKNSYKRPLICSWDFRFFLDDWPTAAKHVEQQIIMARLQNNPSPKISHQFKWDLPALLEGDQQFIARCDEYKKTREVTF